MKTAEFQQQIGLTEAYMQRLIMATKRCDQLTSNDTHFTNIWLIGVNSAEKAIAEGVYYFGPVKTSHKVFF